MEYIVIATGLLASVWDMKTMKIPNIITMGMMIIGLAVGISPYGDFKDSLFGMLIGLVALLPFFYLKGMGGGDVKLSAGFGALMGVKFIINTLLIGTVLGGVASLAYIMHYRRIGIKPPLLPYGIFISAGAVIALFYQIY